MEFLNAYTYGFCEKRGFTAGSAWRTSLRLLRESTGCNAIILPVCAWQQHTFSTVMDSDHPDVMSAEDVRNVCAEARALGMKVLAYSRSVREEGKALADYVSLDELLAKSDVISLHCPLFPETKGIISKDSIAKMKDGVIILNTSRGPLINEQDLADALKSGKVYAAGMDVVSVEPMQADNPLLSAPNCFITPHMAWMTKEARIRLIDIAVNNLRAFLDGKPINNVAG